MTNKTREEDWFPLSAAQRSRWFRYQLDPAGKGTHNIAFAARVHGCIDPIEVADALERLIRRHPMLRVRFRVHRGEPEQCITRTRRVPVSSCDVSGIEKKTLE